MHVCRQQQLPPMKRETIEHFACVQQEQMGRICNNKAKNAYTPHMQIKGCVWECE